MTIKWSFAAQIDYWSNIEYLENEWSENEVRNFINSVDHSIKLLERNNIFFSKTQYKNVFKIVVVKQISLYYQINNDTIILLRFWNNFQNLSNFKLQ